MVLIERQALLILVLAVSNVFIFHIIHIAEKPSTKSTFQQSPKSSPRGTLKDVSAAPIKHLSLPKRFSIDLTVRNGHSGLL